MLSYKKKLITLAKETNPHPKKNTDTDPRPHQKNSVDDASPWPLPQGLEMQQYSTGDRRGEESI